MTAVYGKTRDGLHICISVDSVALAMLMNATIDVRYKEQHLPGQKLAFRTKLAAQEFYAQITKAMGAGEPIEVGMQDVPEPQPSQV